MSVTHRIFLGTLGLGLVQTANAGDFAQPPSLEWKRALPGGKPGGMFHTERAEPLVQGDRIYLGAAGGNALYELSLENGGLLDEYPTAAPVYAAPEMLGDALLFSDSAGYTYLYEPGKDEAVWTHFGGVPISASPTLTRDGVLVATVDDLVFSIGQDSGETQWRYQHPPDAARESDLTLFGAPQPVFVDGDTILAGFSDGKLVALDLSGQVVWQKPVGEGRYPDLIADPTVVENEVFVGAFSQPFLSMDLETQTPRWSLPVGSAFSATRVQDHLMLGGSDGVLRKVESATGEVVWSWDSETSGALTKPVVTEAGVVVASSDGGLYLIDFTSGQMTWTHRPNHNLDGISATPVVHGNRLLVVTNGGNLLCFKSAAPNSEKEALVDQAPGQTGLIRDLF